MKRREFPFLAGFTFNDNFWFCTFTFNRGLRGALY